MIKDITVSHVTFITDRPFKEVVRRFEEEVGTLEDIGLPALTAAATEQEEFRRRVEGVLGRSGFTRFLTIDHGEWATKQGLPTRSIMYVLGNPMIAMTMMQHHVEAGLDVPVRLAIYEDADGRTRVVFNTPSSLMSGLENADVQAAAVKLDAKMIALGKTISGAEA